MTKLRRFFCWLGLHSDRTWLTSSHRYAECRRCKRRTYKWFGGNAAIDQLWLCGEGDVPKSHRPIPPKGGSGTAPPKMVLDATDYTAMKRGVRVFILPSGEKVELKGYW